MVAPFPSMYIPEWLFCWQGASCGPREFAGHRCSLGMVRGRSAVSWRGLSVLGDSCGHPELPRRDADYALEVVGELALVREAGVRRHLRQGQIRPCLQELPGPLDAAQDRGPTRPARGPHWPYGSFLSASPSRMAPVMWQLSEARNRTAETTSDRRLFGWSEGLCPLAAASPPSIRKSAPFTKLLSSQARNRAAAATSSGRPIRPSGIAAVR